MSRERSRMFQIATTIEELDGCRRTVKTALHDKALPHVLAMAGHEEVLKDYYRDSGILIAHCYQEGENSVVFPFVEGVSLEERLTRHIEEHDMAAVRKDIRMYYEMLTCVKGMQPFRETKAFRGLFGDVRLPEGMMGSELSNLDMLLSNVIMTDEEHGVLVDYEWVFDFPIPVTYIFARSLMLMGAFQALEQEIQQELYAVGGVRMEDLPLYLEMEIRFQQYVAGRDELHVLSRIYPKMKTHNYPVNLWNTSHFYFAMALIGIDKESGSEKELFYDTQILGDVSRHVVVPDPEKYQKLILRPVDEPCVIRGISCTDRNGAQLTFAHNGQLQLNDDYYFEQIPEILIDDTGITELQFSFQVVHRTVIPAGAGIHLMLQNVELDKRARKLTQRASDLLVRKAGALLGKKQA